MGWSPIAFVMVISVLTKPPRLLIWAPARSAKKVREQPEIRRGLLVDLLVGHASYGKPHVAEPDPHRSAQLDLAGVGADRLALQEKQDEASVAAVGQAKRLAVAVDAALDEHGEVVALAPPGTSSVCGLWGRHVRAKPL